MSVIDVAVEYNIITYNKDLIQCGKGQELIVNVTTSGNKWFTIVDYVASNNDDVVVTIKCPYDNTGSIIVFQDLSCLKIEEQVHCYKTSTSFCYGNIKCLTGLIGKLYIVEVEK